MNSLPWYECLAIFVATTAVTLVLTPVALRFALRHEIVDRPSSIKAQASPVPYLGGLAIVVAFSAVVIAAALIHRPPSGLGTLFIIVGTAVALSVLGVIDDIWGLGPWSRLLVEFGAGAIVWTTGTHAQLVEFQILGHAIPDAVVTVVWVVGVTNAYNMLDNMDGLSAGIAAIASASLFIVSYLNGQFLVSILSLALVGCSLGFLRHNFHPASIYMGDAGSLYLGFLISVLCLRLRAHEASRISFVVPLLIVGVPLFDSALVVVNRIAHHRNPLQGGRDHTSHRMVFVGLTIRASVALIYAAGVSLGWLAIAVSRVDREAAYVIGGLVLGIGLFAGVMLSWIPVYESSTRRHVMLTEVRPRRSTDTRDSPAPRQESG